MIGIERLVDRIRRYSDESRMRANAVLTAAAEILVRAIADETNRSFQMLDTRLERIERRVIALEERAP